MTARGSSSSVAMTKVRGPRIRASISLAASGFAIQPNMRCQSRPRTISGVEEVAVDGEETSAAITSLPVVAVLVGAVLVGVVLVGGFPEATGDLQEHVFEAADILREAEDRQAGRHQIGEEPAQRLLVAVQHEAGGG